MKINSLWAGFIVLIITGCSSVTPQVNYYQLSPAPLTQQVDLTLPTLFVERIQLVDFLQQPNLLLQRGNGQIYVTKYHVWAESLDKAIARSLVNTLNKQQTIFRTYAQLAKNCTKNCFELRLLVEQFYPTEQSSVLFSGKYQLYRDQQLLVQQDFNFNQPLNNDGYRAAVTELQKLTVKLASQIKQQLTVSL